jgi:hypothetical protein
VIARVGQGRHRATARDAVALHESSEVRTGPEGAGSRPERERADDSARPGGLGVGWKLAKAYAEVDAREDNVCQVSGVKLSPAARDTKRLREHHHIKGRNVKPEWVYESRRIVLCSKFVHDLFTGKALLLDSTDATQPLKLRWNRAFIKPGKEAIRLEGVVS